MSCQIPMHGGASVGQPVAYFHGGSRKRLRGGFTPSLMGGVLSNGPLLMTPALAQGFRLLRNNTERLRTRNRKTRHRSSKRSKKVRKNTRKA
jgi:hypothetical protein